jgi:hypothetical protein
MWKGLMKRFATLLVGLALMMAPSSAFAQGTSGCQTYGPETCGVTASTDATLPFTGLNAALLVVVGAGLLGTGFVVRRLSRDTN